jgi:Family of unknown function (DUF5715)
MLQASLTVLLSGFLGAGGLDVPVSLSGSSESMERQHLVAIESGYEFLRRPSDVRRAVEARELVVLEPTAALALKYPREAAARPELKHFVERFALRLHEECGERLVVTSLTRPVTRQPRNAHRLSVHPAGMAMDLRVPRSASCRRWLEAALLELEERRVLDVTRERSPAHYHVALFPDRYLAHMGLNAHLRPHVVATRVAPAPAADGIPHATPR